MNALRSSLRFQLFLSLVSRNKKQKSSEEQSSEREYTQTILMITWIINGLFIIWNQPRVGQFFLSIFARMNFFFCLTKDEKCAKEHFSLLQHAMLRSRSRHWREIYRHTNRFDPEDRLHFPLRGEEAFSARKAKVIFYPRCTFVSSRRKNKEKKTKPSSKTPFMAV